MASKATAKPKEEEEKDGTLEPLTVSQAEKLKELEEVIGGNLLAFQKVGMALKIIKEQQLYRQEYKNFEDYCRNKWGMGRNYAYKQIAAAKVMENLSTSVHILPMNESQVRALTTIEKPEDQRKIWREVIEVTPEIAPTTKLVVKYVKQFKSDWKVKEISDYDKAISSKIDNFAKNMNKMVSGNNGKVDEKLLLEEIINILRNASKKIKQAVNGEIVDPLDEILKRADTLESNIREDIMPLVFMGYSPEQIFQNFRSITGLVPKGWKTSIIKNLVLRWAKQEKDGEISLDLERDTAKNRLEMEQRKKDNRLKYISSKYEFEKDRPLNDVEKHKIKNSIYNASDDGISLQEISEKLNADGVPTFSGNGKWDGEKVRKVRSEYRGLTLEEEETLEKTLKEDRKRKEDDKRRKAKKNSKKEDKV